MIWLQAPSNMVGALAQTAVQLYIAFGLTLLYLDIRGRKEGFDLEAGIARLEGGPRGRRARVTLRLMVAAVLLAAASVHAGAAGAPSLVPPPAKADAAILSAVVRDSGVEREVPKPGWSEYVVVIMTAAFGWVWDQLRPLALAAPPRPRRRRRRGVGLRRPGVAGRGVVRRPPSPSATSRAARVPVDAASAASDPAPPSSAGPADWLRELERRLDAGDVAGALEALWWFLARSISSGEVRPSWTSGELLARSRRHELRPFAVQLDRFRYGPRGPSPSDVRDLAVRLEQALA